MDEPGKDVVELVQQHGLPDPVQVLVRVRVQLARHHGRRGPQLGLAEQVLAAPVALLGLGLRGVRRAVDLQVELTGPDRRVLAVLLLGGREELGRGLDRHPRRGLQVRHPARGRDELAGRAATAVAVPERHQRPGRRAVLGEVALRVCELAAGQVGVVGVDRREVGEHPGPVQALPPEGVVRELVLLVPGDLLGQEPLRPGQLHQLRQRRGVAERVRQPDLLGVDAVLVQEEPLAVHELPGQRLAAGQVGVGLDPHAAHRNDGAVGNGLLQPLPHLRVVVLHPGVLLGLREREDELRVLLRQGGDVRDRAGHLAPGLPQRPEPGRVDVRVPDRGQLVRAGVRRPAQYVGQLRAGVRRGAGDVLVVQGVQRAAQCPQDLPAARLLQGQLLLQAVQRLEVEDQVPHLGVEHGQVGASQRVDRRLAELGADVGLRVGVVERDLRVGGRLDVELDGVAGRGRRTVGAEDRQRGVGLPRVQTLQRYAGRGVNEALRGEPGAAAEAEVDDGLDLATGPLGRHLAAEPEPRGSPGRTPRQADRGRLEGLGEGLGGGHRLTGGVPHLDVQRDRRAVDRGADPLPQGALEPLLDELTVVVHEIILRGVGPCLVARPTRPLHDNAVTPTPGPSRRSPPPFPAPPPGRVDYRPHPAARSGQPPSPPHRPVGSPPARRRTCG